MIRYKAWADADLLRAARELPASVADKAPIVLAIIRHFHTVDCIFRAHLLGIPHAYTSVNPAEPAALTELAERVEELDEWYVDYVRNVRDRELDEVLNVRFMDGEESRLTRAEILLHVLFHGAGHRGNISILFKLAGADAPPDRFANFLKLD